MHTQISHKPCYAQTDLGVHTHISQCTDTLDNTHKSYYAHTTLSMHTNLSTHTNLSMYTQIFYAHTNTYAYKDLSMHTQIFVGILRFVYAF